MDFTTLPFELQNIIIDELDEMSASAYFVINRTAREVAKCIRSRHQVTRFGIISRQKQLVKFYVAGKVKIRIYVHSEREGLVRVLISQEGKMIYFSRADKRYFIKPYRGNSPFFPLIHEEVKKMDRANELDLYKYGPPTIRDNYSA